MALRRPKQLQPKNALVDMSVQNTFTCVVDGDVVTHYRVFIYNATNNNQEWASGNQTLVTPIDTNETLEMTIPDSTTTGLNPVSDQELYWVVEYSANGTDYKRSEESFFKFVVEPTRTTNLPSTVNSQTVTVTGTYTQPASFSYDYWYYEFYDADMNLLERTPNNTSTKIEHVFNGLRNGLTYNLKFFVVLEFETVFESVNYQFDVSFSVPTILTKPSVELDYDLTASRVQWGGLAQVTGVQEQGTGNYVADFMVDGNFGYQMSAGSVLTYSNLDIEQEFTGGHVRQFSSSNYDGLLMKLENTVTNDEIIVGRDNGSNWFYKEINGNRLVSKPIRINTNRVYGFVVVQENVYIGVYGEDANLEDLDELTLGSMDEEFLDELDAKIGGLDLIQVIKF